MGFASSHAEAPIRIQERKPLSAAAHVRHHRIMALALLFGSAAFLAAGTMPIWAGIFALATSTPMTPQLVFAALAASGIFAGLAYLVAE